MRVFFFLGFPQEDPFHPSQETSLQTSCAFFRFCILDSLRCHWVEIHLSGDYLFSITWFSSTILSPS